MPKIDKAARRDEQRRKAKFNIPVSRAFLHTLDRLGAERDREHLAITRPHTQERAVQPRSEPHPK